VIFPATVLPRGRRDRRANSAPPLPKEPDPMIRTARATALTLTLTLAALTLGACANTVDPGQRALGGGLLGAAGGAAIGGLAGGGRGAAIGAGVGAAAGAITGAATTPRAPRRYTGY
jgi:hypothetical protein